MTDEPNETGGPQADEQPAEPDQQPAETGGEPEGQPASPEPPAAESGPQPAEAEGAPAEASAPEPEPAEGSDPEPAAEDGSAEQAEAGAQAPSEDAEPQDAAAAGAAEQRAPQRGERRPAESKPKGDDPPPGAELEPIAVEPERELSAEERARLEAEEEERARREAEREAGDEPVARSGPQVEIPAGQQVQATGKRKSSIARVILRNGSGTIRVNDRSLDEYFPRQYLRTIARQPLLTAGYEGSVDVHVRVQGGGISGQAGAVRHGIARALCDVDPELRSELKRRGLLTRDARSKERRKAGLKKARKRPQFSKR